MPRKTFLYQINVTRDCNLRCTHCYIHSEVKDVSRSIQENQLLSIAKGIAEHMESIDHDHAEIHLIGGEPTMLGLAYFKKMLPEIRQLLNQKKFTYEVMIVSNLLSNDMLEIAQLFDRVSTSYEPETRFVSWEGEPKPGLEKLWLKKIKLLQDQDINLSVTTAMTKPVIKMGASHLLDWFYQHGLKQVHFGFFIPEGDGLINIATLFPAFHETSNFLIEAAQWYWAKRESDPEVWVNPVESMLTAIHRNEPLDDIVCPMISGSMDIHWDGSAASCLEAGGSLDPDWSGNVFSEGVKQVAESTHFKKTVLRVSRPQKICINCEEYPVCKSGCSVLFKFVDESDQDCPGFKQFIKYLRKEHQLGRQPKNSDLPNACKLC